MRRLALFRTVTANGGVTIGRGIPEAIDDACLVDVLGRHLHLHSVPHCDLDKMLPELAGNVSQNFVPVLEFYTEHRSGKDSRHFALYFNNLRFGHTE